MKALKCVNPQKWVYVTGICSFAFFLILSLCWRNLFDVVLKSQIQLNPNSIFYKIWLKNPIPIYLEIYLFNFTNAREFERNKTVVPNFEEVGPFLFEETREKVNVSWDDIQGTVTFNQTKKWRLLPEASENFSIKVTNINPIASTIAYISRLWQSELQRKISNTLLNIYEPLLVTASAQEWLFDGIPDEFLDILEPLKKVTEIPIPYNKFGWFYERNGSSSFDGSFTIKTGKPCVDDFGMMVAWNHKNKTEHYADACALVYGTTGELIPPLKLFQDRLTVFASDICSYVTLKFARSIALDGINSYEYAGDESVFDNGTSCPENLCFNLGESSPSGTRNVSSCRFGSPAFISFPHFYLADPYYFEKVSGMNPDEKKHKFTLKVEPKTGVPLAVEAGFQINFLVQSYEWCDTFRGIPKLYIPMLWFKQRVEISKEYLTVLKIVLFMQNHGGYLIFINACIILFCALIFISWRKKNHSSNLIVGESNLKREKRKLF